MMAAGCAQLLNNHSIARHVVAVNRERSCRRLHLVISCDVVLDEKRDAMEWTTNLSAAPFVIELRGDRNCIGNSIR